MMMKLSYENEKSGYPAHTVESLGGDQHLWSPKYLLTDLDSVRTLSDLIPLVFDIKLKYCTLYDKFLVEEPHSLQHLAVVTLLRSHNCLCGSFPNHILYQFSKMEQVRECLRLAKFKILNPPIRRIIKDYSKWSSSYSFIFDFGTIKTNGLSVAVDFDDSYLSLCYSRLLLSGDIESNPGPPVLSKEENKVKDKAINSLRKEVAMLKRKLDKHDRYVQRNLELEKRDRQRNRKESSTAKRYAEGIVEPVKEGFKKAIRDTINAAHDPQILSEAIKTTTVAGATAINPTIGIGLGTIGWGTRLSNATSKINPLLDMMADLLKQVKDSITHLTDMFSFPQDVNILQCISGVYGCVTAIMSKSKCGLIVHAISLANALTADFKTIANLFPINLEDDSVVYESPEGEHPVAQSLISDMMSTALGETDVVPAAGLLAFILGLFTVLCKGACSGAEMVKYFGAAGRAITGFTGIKNMYNWITTYFSDIYYKTVYGVDTATYEFMKDYPKLAKLFAAVKVLKAHVTDEQINQSEEICDQILAIEQELTKFELLAARGNDRINMSIVKSLKSALNKYVVLAEKSPARNVKLRTAPFSLYLYGYPGVGKSVLASSLTTKFYSDYLKDAGYTFANSKFNRLATEEFWEGYANQPIVEMDDFANIKDSPIKPDNSFKELIHMCNTAPYPLPMAFGKKGNMYFDSKFILASSNQEIPEIKSMVDPFAVYRRFNVCAEITIDPSRGVLAGRDNSGREFYKIDTSTSQEFQKDPYIINLYRIAYDHQKKNAIRVNIQDKQGLTFDQFYAYIREKYDLSRQTQLDLLASIKRDAGLKETVGSMENSVTTLAHLKRVFDEDILLGNIAKEKDDFQEVPENSDRDEDLPPIYTGGGPGLFNSLKEFFLDRCTYFGEYIRNAWSGVKGNISKCGTALRGVAEFILSCVSNTCDTVYSLLTTHLSLPIFATVGAAIAAAFAWWLKPCANSLAIKSERRACSFVKFPTPNGSPCFNCSICKCIAFPRYGDMLEYYNQKLFTPQIRKEIISLGIDNAKIMEIQKGIFDCKQLYAQKAYEQAPLVPRPTAYAQKVYEHAPVVPKHTTYAHAKIDSRECVKIRTDAQIGSMRYAEGDQVRIEQTTQVLLRNSVWLQAIDGKGMMSRSNGVFLCGRTLITTAHTILNDPTGSPIKTICIRNPYSTEPSVQIPFEECKISQLKKLDNSLIDLILITFPPAVPSRPKILSRFIDSKAIDLMKEGQLILAGFYEVNGKTVIQEKYPVKFEVHTQSLAEYYQHQPGTCPKTTTGCVCPIKISSFVEYDLDTKTGMCGSLLSISNRSIHTKLVGLHVAGGAGALSLGVLLTHQLLMANLTDHVKQFALPDNYLIDGRYPYMQSFVDDTYKVKLVDEGDCLSVGVAPKCNAPTKTQLSKSLLYGKLNDPQTRPAILSPTFIDGERVDPMNKGIKKLFKPQVWINSDILMVALHDTFQDIGLPNRKPRVLSYEEAIMGVEDDPFIRSLNRTTSPGYPYNLTNKSKGKSAWLGSGMEFDLTNLELRGDVESLLDMAKRGIRGDAISMATLKDEKRPLSKVLAGKTRVFEACPQHLVIAMRQYFGSFVGWITEKRIDNGIAIGINPYSLEWTKLATKLLSKGDNMVAGDFSNFDGSLSYQVLSAICDHICKWYDDGEENVLIRHCLWEHICSADVIVNDEVIRQTHSQPSGNPMTAVINSIYNKCISRVAYLLLKQERGEAIVCDYRKHVADIYYGDDDIKSIDFETVPWFNQVSITRIMEKIGMTYTDETKGVTDIECKSLKNVAFLKRKFVLQTDGTYLAPMEVSNILEICNWVKGKAIRQATIENCECAVEELALHPREVYEYWCELIRSSLRECGVDFHYLTWFEQKQVYMEARFNFALNYNPIW